MLVEIIRQLNWVDIAIFLIIGRIIYIGVKTGFPTELFKLLGTLLATYLSLHYYTSLSDFFKDRFGLAKIPLEFLDFITYLVYVILAYLAFVIMREVLARFIKMEAVPRLNKWGGFVLSLIRSIFLIGLFTYGLVISSTDYLRDSVSKSYTGNRFFKVAPSTYGWLWGNIMSKFMVHEKYNQTITEVQEDLYL